MKIEIKHRYSGNTLCSHEAEENSLIITIRAAIAAGANLTGAYLTGANLTRADLTGAYLTGANLTRADLTRADLTGADLTDANLTGAYLTGANLTRADLTRADLTGADLTGADLTDANLTRADLTGADLTGADLTRADLTDADLTRADLRHIKHDFFGVLLYAQPEIAALRLALLEGKIDGSVYNGECACLMGTIGNIRQVGYSCIAGIVPDANSPAERWFLAIREGDTPEKSPIAKLTVEWIDEFLTLTRP